MPPDGVAVAEPALELPVTLACSTAGCEIVALAVAVAPLPSVAVTVKLPGARFWMLAEVAPFDHKKVMLPVPPVAEAVAVPSAAPLHEIFSDEIETDKPEGGGARWQTFTPQPFKVPPICGEMSKIESVQVPFGFCPSKAAKFCIGWYGPLKTGGGQFAPSVAVASSSKLELICEAVPF